MGYFYIDDSVHDEAGFVLGALIYSKTDLNDVVKDLILKEGFNPDEFEFKSGANYSRSPEKIKIREVLKCFLRQEIQLGLVVIPRNQREKLGIECLKALKVFLTVNPQIEKPTNVFFDQGMFKSEKEAYAMASKLGLGLEDADFNFEQDSKVIRGIQIADLAAHTASIQLKGGLGFVKKMVKVGENSGYDPDEEIELSFEMWATIRYCFFNQLTKESTGDQMADSILEVEPYGLFVSDLCDNDFAENVRAVFSKVYLGCVH